MSAQLSEKQLIDFCSGVVKNAVLIASASDDFSGVGSLPERYISLLSNGTIDLVFKERNDDFWYLFSTLGLRGEPTHLLPESERKSNENWIYVLEDLSGVEMIAEVPVPAFFAILSMPDKLICRNDKLIPA